MLPGLFFDVIYIPWNIIPWNVFGQFFIRLKIKVKFVTHCYEMILFAGWVKFGGEAGKSVLLHQHAFFIHCGILSHRMRYAMI
ncbi:hypothetical protein CIT292_10979 [Citrobacter youngae ATCC 29220]|uniref:Uncharacterized protein n=1 Tax=Citrobacter youngae ATCC 29220 TaxID=500640 RepID=D4BJY5_9ENTR|nr:hypothetical protein CIT292_10979 [Citrobacter youngae ATCC 29220]